VQVQVQAQVQAQAQAQAQAAFLVCRVVAEPQVVLVVLVVLAAVGHLAVPVDDLFFAVLVLLVLEVPVVSLSALQPLATLFVH